MNIREINPITSIKEDTYEMCFREGGIKQINVAQMSEAQKNKCIILYEQSLLGPDYYQMLLKHGEVLKAKEFVNKRNHEPERVEMSMSKEMERL